MNRNLGCKNSDTDCDIVVLAQVNISNQICIERAGLHIVPSRLLLNVTLCLSIQHSTIYVIVM